MSHLSQEEVAVWASVFNTIDEDGDGHITITDCVDVMRKKRRTKEVWLDRMNYRKLEHILAHAPVGAEVKFDFTTFKKWIHHHGQHANDGGDDSGSESDMSESSSSSDEEAETMQQLFSAIDSDRNGFITLEEMLELEKDQAEEMGQVFDEPRRREELTHFMRLGDLDRDHRLSMQEFVMAMRKRAQDGSTFYSDSETDLETADPNARLRRRKSQRKKMERRKSKRVSGLMKLAGVNKKELKVYKETKDDRIDLSDYDVCARLRQVFDTLDNDGDDRIDADEFVALEPHLKNVDDRSAIDLADRKNTLRQLHKKYGDSDDLLPFQEFMNAMYAIRLTNEQLKLTWDSVLWQKEKERVDVTDMDIEDIETGLSTLRASILKTEEDEEPVAKVGAVPDGGELKRVKQQLMLALRLADSLQDKYSRSQAEVGLLTTELLKFKRGTDLPPPPDITNGNDEQRPKRTHAERNQEFFYLTALAVKLNVEAKYKADNAAAPHMLSTRKLYETGMAAKVPFQFYYRWIERQLDPNAHNHRRTQKAVNGKKQ